MIKSYSQKPVEVTRAWHVVDAKGRVLGQVATEIATLLIGKYKPTFTPHTDGGDYVVVINAETVETSGNKATDKKYYSYSGFPGGLSSRSVSEMRTLHPERLIEQAVYNMLPKNKLRTGRVNRLKVYVGAEHPHSSQLAGEVVAK
jgi:large subunit ribosomal protein L13